jgi:selenide,water dikinase
LACASKVTIQIDARAVPLLDGAMDLAAAGMLTSGDKTNREYIGADVEIAPSTDPNLVKLLFDPQTAGGMLIAVAEAKAQTLLNDLRSNYPQAQIIGRVLPRGSHSLLVS